MPSTWFPKEPPKLIFKTQDKIGENIAQLKYNICLLGCFLYFCNEYNKNKEYGLF